jgi:hydrogenase expression/formation protein HypD
VKHITEFRQAALSRALVEAIKRSCHKPLRVMEVCGSHTMSIFKQGIKSLLPPQIELISGPGCPVCVTAPEEIELAIKLAAQPGVIMTSFGDMLKVPGASGSLAELSVHGADVRLVYSPMDALKLAQANPKNKVVFYGIGFETTAPTIAATIIAARREGLDNFSVLSVHKLIPPAIGTLLSDDGVQLDGFLCPGHVSVIIGAKAYEFVSSSYHKPAVIAGFEPVDILDSILRLVKQHEAGEAKVEIQYMRAVTREGNIKAQQLMQAVFETTDARWRGLGLIPASGLKIRPTWAKYDARSYWDIKIPPLSEPKGCICGQVLRGVNKPPECVLFGDSCTPESPVGPCMVSTEGSCAAYYKYQPKAGLI